MMIQCVCSKILKVNCLVFCQEELVHKIHIFDLNTTAHLCTCLLAFEKYALERTCQINIQQTRVNHINTLWHIDFMA